MRLTVLGLFIVLAAACGDNESAGGGGSGAAPIGGAGGTGGTGGTGPAPICSATDVSNCPSWECTCVGEPDVAEVVPASCVEGGVCRDAETACAGPCPDGLDEAVASYSAEGSGACGLYCDKFNALACDMVCEPDIQCRAPGAACVAAVVDYVDCVRLTGDWSCGERGVDLAHDCEVDNSLCDD